MKLKFLLVAFVAFSLTSCLDMFETITLNNDGSGVYELKLDMAKAITMMEGMTKKMDGGGPSSSKKKKEEKVDSSFSFAKVVDTVKGLSPREKAIFKKATGQIKIDEKQQIAFVHLKFPFASAEEFTIIQKVMNDKEGSMGDFGIIKSILNKKDKSKGQALDNPGKAEVPGKDFIYELTANSFSRKVKETKKAAEGDAGDKAFEDMKLPAEMMEMFKLNINLTVNLPREVKNVEGKDAIISADKKQIKFSKQAMMDVPFKAADFDCKVEF